LSKWHADQGSTLLKPGSIDVGGDDCRALGAVLARIGDKWTVFVVGLLSKGPMRFNEIRRTVGGISQRMLTLTLRGLERDGMVTRTVSPTIPPKVEYALTPLGCTLIEPLLALGDWARQHHAAVEAARAKFDADRTGDTGPRPAIGATSNFARTATPLVPAQVRTQPVASSTTFKSEPRKRTKVASQTPAPRA
jgi:DNA-binding HxlR family transcriptional regulator